MGNCCFQDKYKTLAYDSEQHEKFVSSASKKDQTYTYSHRQPLYKPPLLQNHVKNVKVGQV